MSNSLPNPETPKVETGIQSAMPTQPVPAPTVPEVIAYQPISGWAVAGFAAGALFAVLVLIATGVALSQGAPMFFPIWVVGLAVAGVVLSLLGQWHVQNSEGTRAGAKLARAGVWLGLISGLSYLSYYFVTGLALQSQANEFLMAKADDDSGFFPRLREGATDPVQLNAAFLLTRPRRTAKPDNEEKMLETYDAATKDGMPGDLSQFKYALSPGFNGTIVRIFSGGAAKDVEVTPLAVQEWKYEQKSYQVRRNYRIKTKELNWEVTLAVASTEAEAAGQGRKWFVNLTQSGPVTRELSRFGEGLAALRFYAKADLERWIGSLNEGKAFAGIKERDKTDWNKRFGDDYLEKRDLVHKLFENDLPHRVGRLTVFARGDEVGRWEEVGDKVRVDTAFRFEMSKAPGQRPAYFVDAFVTHETVKGGINLAELSPTAPPPEVAILQIVITGVSPWVESKGMGPN